MSYKKLKDKAAILLRNHMFRHVAFLTTSSAAGRLVAFVSLPVITRIYSPSSFGQFSIFAATLGLLVPIATLRFSAAIPLPRHSGLAINLFFLCLITTSAVALISAALLGSTMLFAEHLNVPGPSAYYWLIVVGLLGVGLFETLNAWALRRKKFKPIAIAQMSQSFWSVALKVVLGLLGLKAGGLILGHVVSMTAGVASLARATRGDIAKASRFVSFRRMRIASRRFAAFPKLRLPAQFLLAFASQFPILFVGFFYGKGVAGQIGLTLTCIAIPISLVGASLGQVFFAEMAKLGKGQPEKIRDLIRSLLYSSGALILLPVVVLALLGPGLFTFVFGEEWLLAGIFAQIFSLYLGVQFCAVPLVNTFSVFGDQKSFLVINGVRVALIIGVFLVTYLLKLDEVFALTLFSAVLTVHYIYVIWSVFKMVDQACLKNVS